MRSRSSSVRYDVQSVAKPALAAYGPTLLRFAPEDLMYFGARTAQCTMYEQDPCEEIWDEKM